MYGSATVLGPFKMGARSKITRLDILIRSVSEKIVRRTYAGSPWSVLNILRSYGVQFLANTVRIPESGSVNSYRCIAKMGTIAEFFVHCVDSHLIALVSHDISPHQYGFNEHYFGQLTTLSN